ncbi:MAG: hypothetical protein ACRDJH_02030 [Thermomicrobiales bacterium]
MNSKPKEAHRLTTPLRVRGVRLLDLPTVRRMHTVVRLNQPEVHLTPYSPLRSALASLAPGGRAKPRFFVALAANQMVGFVHLQSTAPDQRWQMIALGATTMADVAAPIWEELVAHATVAAGARGVKRIYARAARETSAVEALRAVGFAPYATETVFLARTPRAVTQETLLRPQEQSDTWAIHQLYNAAVPRQVQYAEAFTSHRWDVRTRFEVQPGTDAAGWLIEDGHHVVGYARVLTLGSAHILELLYHPERRDVLDTLLDGVLWRLVDGGRARQIYCAVRGYQTEAGGFLERRGFVPVLEQELHLKYTTANVRIPATESVVFHTEVKEKLPKRVPSFLQGRSPDGSAT